ncbi:MAG: SDR family oxidoreductase, partial [Burkholderiales bacterium]|nr:SDR family oxidoreductase [Burkholderiales bacterium]
SAGRLDASASQIEAAAPEARGIADRVLAVRANAMERAEVAAVVEAGLARFGRIDVLVNVVGGIRGASLYTPFLQLDEVQWDATFALNLKPGFHLIQFVAPGMLQRGSGKIVNVASVVYAGEGGQADYAAAKASVASLTRSLAQEFAPHVRVNCIAPGLIRTSVVERLAESERQGFLDKSLLRRLGEPDEIADAVAFLCSDESSFMTGEILAVSGGNHPGL